MMVLCIYPLCDCEAVISNLCRKHYQIYWYHKNKYALRDRINEYYKTHKKSLKYYYKNIAVCKVRMSRYQRTEKYKAYQRNYKSIKRDKNISFKITENMRNRLQIAIKSGKKKFKTLVYVGCSLDELRKHIESQFKDGMLWSNYGKGYGKWGIDHIKPCSSFNLSNELEIYKCFNYTNLQPLWHNENSSKNDKNLASK